MTLTMMLDRKTKLKCADNFSSHWAKAQGDFLGPLFSFGLVIFI